MEIRGINKPMGKRVKVTTQVDDDLYKKYQEVAKEIARRFGVRPVALGRVLDNYFREMIASTDSKALGWLGVPKKKRRRVYIKKR